MEIAERKSEWPKTGAPKICLRDTAGTGLARTGSKSKKERNCVYMCMSMLHAACIGLYKVFRKTKEENRGYPALCVSGNFQGKQRVFGAPFWKLAVFPESESWSGAKSEAKLRKSTKYPDGRRVNSRYARVLRKIPGILPIWPKLWLILGPNQPQTRLRAAQSPK